MEYYFFIIVIIVLKILFWTFYFYVRAQRMRQAQTSQRFIIVGARPIGRQPHPCSDRSAIIHHAEPVAATGPPPYAEVVKDGQGAMPPSYEQIMAGFMESPASSIPDNTGTAVPPYSASLQPEGESVLASHDASMRQAHTGPVP